MHTAQRGGCRGWLHQRPHPAGMMPLPDSLVCGMRCLGTLRCRSNTRWQAMHSARGNSGGGSCRAAALLHGATAAHCCASEKCWTTSLQSLPPSTLRRQAITAPIELHTKQLTLQCEQ